MSDGPGTDYRNKMSDSTRDLDEVADRDAQEKTVANYAAGVTQVKKYDEKYHVMVKTDQGVFGMLPEIALPLDHALERKQVFTDSAQGHQIAGWGDKPSGKSLAEMATRYNDDLGRLPTAERLWRTLVPLANMSARSFAKAESLGVQMEWNSDDSVESKLNDKEKKAVGAAVKGNRMSHASSLHNASAELSSARKALGSASHALSVTVNEEAMAALNARLDSVKSEKETIEAKKAKVIKIVGYIETAGSIIAGGAKQVGGAPPPVETGPDLRPDWAQKAEKVGEGAGSGTLSKAVSFGVELYYHDELIRLESQMDSIKRELASYDALNRWHKIEAVKQSFDAAVVRYKNAVDRYQDTIADRRAEMAAIGAAAETAVDKKGENHRPSEGMLWMETVMELQVHLQTARSAGSDARAEIEGIATEVLKTRYTKWGFSNEHYNAVNKPHTESQEFPDYGGPDADALQGMRRLLGYWLDGADRLQVAVDKAASRDAAFMKKNGFDGDF